MILFFLTVFIDLNRLFCENADECILEKWCDKFLIFIPDEMIFRGTKLSREVLIKGLGRRRRASRKLFFQLESFGT